jgi:ATP-binding cassette, subfamily B, bacterial MsbA
MKNFALALREAWRHWPALVGALVCSLGVAALWSANIAALFPIIETTLHKRTLQDWNRDRIVKAEAAVVAQQAELVQLKHQLAKAPVVKQKELELQISLAESQLVGSQASVRLGQRVQPWIEQYLPAKPFSTVVFITLFVVLATALKQCLMIGNALLVSFVSQSIARDIRGRIFDKSLSLDRPGFNQQGISGFAAHITHTTDMLASGITNFYGGAVTEPLRIMACLICAMFISWRLTLASMIFAPLAAFLMLHLNRKIRQLSVKYIDRSLGFHHVMLEVFNSLLTVQANTMELFERERFRQSTSNMRSIALKSTFYNALASPVTEVLGMGMLCTGIIVSSYLVINQETAIFGIKMSNEPLSVSAVTVFFGLLIGAADPLRKLSGVITGINTGMAASNILYPLFDIRSTVAEPAHPVPFPSPHHTIEFNDIRFSYDGIQNALDGVSLTIERGEHLAVVGPNGGGKSTLINLLCRFYDPQEGDVTINGVSLRQIGLADLRKHIALVNQQTELFNETILHNIRYGRWDATDEEVIAAAELARAHEFVSNFPEGYRTLVGPNGQRLSGGQRQRIALARAFLRNTEVLILDEATSQIDVESERLIHEALAEFGRDRTLVMITHRESTLSLASKVVRLEHGVMTTVRKSALQAA